MTGHPEPTTRAMDAERLAGHVLAIALLAFAVPVVLQGAVDLGRIEWWWNLPLGAATVTALGLAAAGRGRVAARVLVLTSVVGAVTVPAAVEAPLGSTTWVAALLPVTVGACAVVSTRTTRSLATLAVVLGSGLVAYSQMVPDPERPPLLRLILLVATWSVVLALVRSLEYAERRGSTLQDVAVEEYVAARASEATVRSEQAWDAYLHDEVVATLTLVAEGPADEARSAVADLVGREPWGPTGHGVPTPWIREGSLDAVLRHRPDAETVITVSPDVGAFPEEVRRAVLEALSEAIRNVDRHAYGPSGEGPARVELVLDRREVRIVVTDEGRGFDPRTVDGSSMGIAVSIQARMDAVGGWSSVESAPGQGTRVRLGWRGPATGDLS